MHSTSTHLQLPGASSSHRLVGPTTISRCTSAAAQQLRRRARSSTRRSSTLRDSSSTAAAAATTANAAANAAATAVDPASTTWDDDSPHEQLHYSWKWGSRISFVRAGRSGPPLLLCHGFGVGAFHFERNIPQLAKSHRVYAVDLLGQGDSWPTQPQCEESGPLRFSADTWTEQLYHFIQEKIGEPVYLAGNSLGGYLGVHLAAKHPEAVRGLILLNATPFWSQRPPVGQERGLLWRALRDVDAAVPIKHGVKGAIERLWWDQIRQPATIRSLLQLVYARPSAIDDSLLERIVAATQRPDALDAFTSILLSPRTQLTFNEMLVALSCPVCMAYGQGDPWVVPLWGQRLKRILPEATYLELAPAGHCPHHEAPAAINAIIAQWIAAQEAASGQQQQQGTGGSMLRLGSITHFEEAGGEVVTVSCIEGKPRNIAERWDYASWRLQNAVNEALQRLRGDDGQQRQQS